MLINKNFQIIKTLGSGGFGEIFEAINVHTNKHFALKVEPKQPSGKCYLKNEMKTYKYLKKHNEKLFDFIPEYFEFFENDENYYLVMELLGPSLSQLFKKCQRKFSLSTVLNIAISCLQILKTFHFSKLIHKDIKPGNILVGIGEKSRKLFLIDYGFTKKFLIKDGSHISIKSFNGLTGTPRYASVNNHFFLEQSRRDDLESLGYVLIYLLKGILPWQKFKGTSIEKNMFIREKKMKVTTEDLCQDIPAEFRYYLDYCKSLQFQEEPDYEKLLTLFKNCYQNNNINLDMKYCWEE